MPTLLATAEFASAQAAFVGGRSYLAACTVGIPTIASRAAIIADLDAAAAGRPDPAGYSAAVERTRGHFASLVGITLTEWPSARRRPSPPHWWPPPFPRALRS